MLSVSTLVVLLFAWQQGASASYVYVKHTLPVIPCKENSAKDVCPDVTHKIPDFSGISNEAAASIGNSTLIKSTLNPILAIPGLPDDCKKGLTNYFCTMFLPVCDEKSDQIIMFGSKTTEMCKEAKLKCSAIASFLNCDDPSFGPEQKHPRRAVCKDYPELLNDPYKCDNINYKVPEMMTRANVTVNVVEAHKMLKADESKLDASCVSTISGMICSILAPACSKDRKYIFDVISKEDCNERKKCLDGKGVNPDFLSNATEWCNSLVNNTAQKFEADDVLDDDDDDDDDDATTTATATTAATTATATTNSTATTATANTATANNDDGTGGAHLAKAGVLSILLLFVSTIVM